jgi:glycosyltransferase involved in cell wall biosynthesis
MNSPTTHDVLLTVSGTIPDGVEHAVAAGERPEPDYVAMARSFGADLLDHPGAARASGTVGKLIGRVAGANAVLAWECYRRRKRYRTIFTDGEQVGFPLAALLLMTRRRPRHVMIGHVLTTRSKTLVHRLLGLRRRIDDVVVYASAQQRYAVEHLGYAPSQVVLTPFMVDTRFWDPALTTPAVRSRPLLCALGRELRDYPTLIEAVRGLDVDLVISTASAWSRRDDALEGRELPSNVEWRSFDLPGLRQLYADAALVVVPLVEADFQTGITTILEGMSMGRAIVCSRTSGQRDTVVDGEQGVYVPPGDVMAMRAAIGDLLADPVAARRMGAAGREWALQRADVRVYADRLAGLVAPAPTAQVGAAPPTARS